MTCACCLSDVIDPNPLGLNGYSRCGICGFLFLTNNPGRKILKEISQHYQWQDPHKKVSHSKIPFYNSVLRHLESRVKKSGKNILDIGCGYGYFLKMASKSGWKSNGVEVVQDAAKSCREKFGYGNVFHVNLKDARLLEKSFDAITLWDVIAIIDNPYDDLQECYRLLKKGGIIGIRTRNVSFQIFIYRLFNLIRKIALKFNLKEPYVFNKFCFSSKSINALLTRLGFVNIEIFNSPLTSGDPYGHMGLQFPIKLTKYFLNIISKLIFWISGGRLLIGPSLLIWAEKP